MINIGETIDNRYNILEHLGTGGMADVFEAKDLITSKIVAIKILKEELKDEKSNIASFSEEARSSASMSHQNIMEIYNEGSYKGCPYLVIEYLENQTLLDKIEYFTKFSVNEGCQIMLQLLEAISYTHRHNIIHRDIKPQNIMILSNGMIKITDFGVATALNSTQLTQTNSVMGTVHYLPPEQAQGKGSTIRSDIYSMGIMMYELLVGHLPYKGESAVEIALKHLKEPLPSIRDELPDLPQFGSEEESDDLFG